ncbi:MAG: hypothetical protein M3511_11100, partial [Deinococcota bacterium]|nr:hypothetical protein [Deinococcota bacterium]
MARAVRGGAVSSLLWFLVLLSLVPGLWLAAKRHQAEQASRTVTLLIDGLDLYTQADLLGLAAPELGQRYRALGLNGIALYEETLETLTH